MVNKSALVNKAINATLEKIAENLEREAQQTEVVAAEVAIRRTLTAIRDARR